VGRGVGGDDVCVAVGVSGVSVGGCRGDVGLDVGVWPSVVGVGVALAVDVCVGVLVGGEVAVSDGFRGAEAQPLNSNSTPNRSVRNNRSVGAVGDILISKWPHRTAVGCLS
jgi:hypothetical protein